MRKLADKRGYGHKRTIFLADGSEHIWRAQKKYFPDAEPCVDWFHIVEKLWTAGECLHHEGSAELKAWVAQHTRNLRYVRVGAVLAALSAALAATPRTGPGNKGKRKRLAATLNHLTHQRHRMRYGRFRREDLPIGSGVVEGAVRNLVGMRLDGPGMRWGRSRSELVLHLRCILLNGQWGELSEYLTRRGLAPRSPCRRAPTTRSHVTSGRRHERPAIRDLHPNESLR
ncbi:MAG: transposase [Polyangiaceae bacterium]|nr:transposase [Polyangiaceae bacterium]